MEPFILILNLGWLCDWFPSPCPDIPRAVCFSFPTLLPCLEGHAQLLLCWVWETHKLELSHSTWCLGHGAIFSLYESGKRRGDRVSHSDSLNTRRTDAYGTWGLLWFFLWPITVEKDKWRVALVIEFYVFFHLTFTHSASMLWPHTTNCPALSIVGQSKRRWHYL